MMTRDDSDNGNIVDVVVIGSPTDGGHLCSNFMILPVLYFILVSQCNNVRVYLLFAC
ncbi:transmembrane protein, putative [Medicago truncatula]|uniref:Transmembrane protein, putative n=1 Tax=Medicago truncatula TaxID=3880 RepID=G7K510_MEDTR|nr:transmembrane protein, putative [Medicago truncatula]